MSKISMVLMLFLLTSCELLLSPPAIAIEEEIAEIIIQDIEQEIQSLEK